MVSAGAQVAAQQMQEQGGVDEHVVPGASIQPSAYETGDNTHPYAQPAVQPASYLTSNGQPDASYYHPPFPTDAQKFDTFSQKKEMISRGRGMFPASHEMR